VSVFHIKRGYDIPIGGRAEPRIEQAPPPTEMALRPVDIRGIKPRLLISPGDTVSVGTPLVEDKNDPRILLTSPAAGTISTVNRGPRRRLDEVVIEIAEGEESYVEFPARTQEEIEKDLEGSVAISNLLKAGLWPYFRQRPFSKVAAPDDKPQAIFVSAMETEPLLGDPTIMLQDHESEFKAGMAVLPKLTEGNVYLCIAEDPAVELTCLTNPEHATLHRFSGPHPAGSVGTHIHHIEPLRKDQVIWYLKAVDVAAIGHFFLTGRCPTERIYAVVGEGASERNYFRSRNGVPIHSLPGSQASNESMRFISGSILTGMQLEGSAFMGFYDTTLTVLPEGGERRFLGWLAPGLKINSACRTYLSAFFQDKEYPFDTSMHAGHRAIVPIGAYEKVMALDIQPTFLIKSLIYGDLEEAERLGLLECGEEDVALCSYVCPAKTDFCGILRTSLDAYEKEG